MADGSSMVKASWKKGDEAQLEIKPLSNHYVRRRCSSCLEDKPLDEYLTDEATTCNHCAAKQFHDISPETRKNLSHETIVYEDMQRELEVFARRGQRSISAPHISELSEAVNDRFGGVRKFAELFYKVTMSAIQENPGGIVACRMLQAYVQLVKSSTEHRKSAPDMAMVTEEELREQILSTVMNQCSEDEWRRIGDARGFNRPRLNGPAV